HRQPSRQPPLPYTTLFRSAAQRASKQADKDATQGVQLATMKNLARYWGTDYDWRKCEAKLNALPQFITEIDGLDIHFIHIRSKQDRKSTRLNSSHLGISYA